MKPSRRQDIHAAMHSDLTGMLQRLLCVPEAEAVRLASLLYVDMRRQWGGRQVHFYALTAPEQADQIYAAWRGDNVAEVCAMFGISRAGLYRVLAYKSGTNGGAKNPKIR